MTQGEIGAATARLLFEAGAVHLSHDRPFILAAGWASPIYIDCRRLIGEPRAVTHRDEHVDVRLRHARGLGRMLSTPSSHCGTAEECPKPRVCWTEWLFSGSHESCRSGRSSRSDSSCG